MKELILRIFPDSLVRIIFNLTIRNLTIYKSYKYDKKKFKKYSDSFLMKRKNEIMGNIIKHYHVFEKGLTMPETRLGFGQPKMVVLVNECLKYIQLFGKDEIQLSHSVSVINEYLQFHEKQKHQLEPKTIEAIENLNVSFSEIKISAQPKSTKESYFEQRNASFDLFSVTRHSVRNFSKESIPQKLLEQSLKLAKKTPSACNRQSWRTYVYSDKTQISEILKVQGGNRGFGHLTDKLIVITGELGVFGHAFERNQVFIDGGMYAMNLLYALHFNGIATCPLNCSNTPEKDKKLQALCGIKASEVFIVMIACGIPPDEFKLASSPRYDVNFTNRFVADK
ncbi:nitroreductase family protein [Maribacter aquivivus]|uniref:nitroreductase family protein n=1 Tax=Maribacter aquivivus TaxID=228958 RepID=UPI002493D076|nr:nitroreductase family protein [Maribacter aquivivus]